MFHAGVGIILGQELDVAAVSAAAGPGVDRKQLLVHVADAAHAAVCSLYSQLDAAVGPGKTLPQGMQRP